jgi:hypothetical protein
MVHTLGLGDGTAWGAFPIRRVEKGNVFWRIFVAVVVLKDPIEDGRVESSSWRREYTRSALRDN